MITRFPKTTNKSVRRPRKAYDSNKHKLDETEITFKGFEGGPAKKVDLEDFKVKLLKLREKKHVKVHDLDSKTLKIFNEIAKTVKLLSANGSYSLISPTIQEVFGLINKCKALTVGCFFSGNNVETNLPGNPRCSPYSAGSIPSVHGGDKPCDKLVIIYEHKNRLVIANKPCGSNKFARIFIHKSINFCGFTSDEILKLKNLGVEKVEVFRYDDGWFSSETNGESVSLNDLRKYNKVNNMWWWILILSIILFLFYYFMYSKKKKYRALK